MATPPRDPNDQTLDDASDTGLYEPVAGPAAGAPFHIDFSTFEESEAEAQAASSAPDAAPRRGSGPDERETLVRSLVPSGDVSVDVRPLGGVTVVTLRGRINESFHGAELGRSLTGTVVFDLSQVDRVSSFGVKGWLQMLEQSSMDRILYYRCSEAVVNQVTMMRNFCGNGQIHSLLVPYACPGCGEEFGAVFDAVADRELILGRSAPPVVCPACTNAAEVADDPFAYMAVDAHLLPAVAADLEQVFEHLSAHVRVDPVEKFVSADETRVRFNTALTARVRLARAFAGLEGRVILDFSVCPSLDAGLESLIRALNDLEPEIREAGIDGCTPKLAKALLAAPPPRVFVKSLFCDAVCTENKIRRPVLVDVERRLSTLLEGKLPPLTATWADGRIELVDAKLLFDVARVLGPREPQPRAASSYPPGVAEQVAFTHVAASPAWAQTPAPAPYATPAPAPYATPYATPAPAPYATPAPPGYPTHPGAAYTAPPPGYALPAPPPDRRPWIFAAVVATLSISLAVGSLGLWLLTLGTSEPTPPAPAPVAVAPAPAPTALPPAWVDQPFVEDAEGVLVVGRGVAITAEEAAEMARLDAVAVLVERLRERVKGSPAERALGQPRPERRVDAARAFLEAEGSWVSPRRVDADVRSDTGGPRVSAQYRIDRTTWDRLEERYRAVASFRGLDVAHRLATGEASEPRLVVVKLESWFDAGAVGDAVLSAGGRSFSDLASFASVTAELWDDLAPGQSFSVALSREGQPVELSFRKPGGGGPAAPAAPQLMPLGNP